ncbi:PAS domain S-box protein [Rhodobaculum claviforme]|uniref:histidine kinase n=1 Tax=Rhodobaculum claviforme TaxID=1549854 RepID=A0A934TNC3_9RHOB|nr:PAS domain S-box protein [Rhodobaculum claviforme]MBK5928761.1 hypothetical protein [Rhodobaculum claviforme]
MDDAERLRTTLIELERLRARERAASHESATLLTILEGMTAVPDCETASTLLLETCRDALAADAAALVRERPTGGVEVILATDPALTGLGWDGGAAMLGRPRRMTDLHRRDWGAVPPPALADYHGLLTAHVKVEQEARMAILCLSRRVAAFSAADHGLLRHVGRVAGQALTNIRLARSNTLLSGLIAGDTDIRPAGLFDAPLEAVTRAFDRLTRAQAVVVEITNDLLRAPRAGVDAAIDRALARCGALAQSDRTYVFRVRLPEWMDNTHEWVAPGIAPMRTELQGMPLDLLGPWQDRFDADEEVYIPDVTRLPADDPTRAVLEAQNILSLLAVPMREDGRLTGFVGFDAVRTTRTFLPGEIFLLRSVATVINGVLERRAAETAAEEAGAALQAERNRMQATLQAMPDLVLELDATGRFTDYHVGRYYAYEAEAAALIGRIPEEVFPPESAAQARRIMAEVDREGIAGGQQFFAERSDGRHWFELSAAARGDAEGGYIAVVRDVTQARAQLREIERLSEIARRTTNQVVITDTDGRIDWVNAAFEARTGWCLSEVRGRKPGDFLQPPETDPDTIARIRAALHARVPSQTEILNRDRHGEDYWIALDIQPMIDGEGRHTGFMAMQTDVTERRRHAAQLAATTAEAVSARARLVSAMEALQDGFAIYDADGRLVMCNDTYRYAYPRSADMVRPGVLFQDLVRRRLADGEYRDAQGREEDWLAARIAAHRSAFHETEQPLADGRWVRVMEKATPDGGCVAMRVDITALKEAEKRALEERAAAMEASRDGIAITDPEGRFVYMNPSHRLMFGIPPDEDVRGKHWSMLYHPDVAEALRHSAFPVLEHPGARPGVGWQGELKGRHRDGSVVEQEISLTLKHDGGLVCISRDIADRHRSEAERARLREELQLAQRREIVGQLAAGLAHDFNNILAVISGSAAMIEGRQVGDGPDAVDAMRIGQASARATELVARLRDLGRHGSDRRRVDMRQPVNEAADLLRSGLESGHKLVVSVPPTPMRAWADPVDVLQVVLNLAINARDALGPERNQITLSLAPADPDTVTRPPDLGRFRPGRPAVCLRVADTGPGMDAATRARVFEPYFSTKGARGTGLGLAIVSGVVRANGAALWLDTEPGKGTTVTIFWPLTDTEPPAGTAPPMTGNERLDGMRLLVVDDADQVCEVLGAILETAGAEVATATDPADALQAIEDDPRHWSALVTDQDMPGMTGLELSRAALRAAPGLPIVMVTALPEAVTDDAALFDAILGKPVAPTTLVAAVARAVRSRG